MPSPPTAGMRASIRQSAAPRATCRRAPTWSSIRATTTACAFRGPTSRSGSGRRTPATTAMPTRPLNGRRTQSKAGTVRNAKAFSITLEAFHDAWAKRADAEALLAAAASDPQTPGFARAGAACRARALPLSSTVGLARSSLADPDPMVRIGALDMLESAPPEEIWPVAAPLLSDPVRGVRVRAADLARRGSGGQSTRRRPSRHSTAQPPSLSLRRSSTPTARKRV